ncbi:MAG: hypothetical protein QOJ10_1938 [Chloroflexota bacterium]|nr:hypothetical protein [Chloroflexota bacterium]
MRWLALAAGAVLVVIAFLAGARVADTREGLLFEVTALLAGLAGVLLILYGWVAATARAHSGPSALAITKPPAAQVRSANDLLIGGVGLAVGLILLAGIALSSGVLWAALGLVLLLPMMVGSGFLCLRFLRAPERVWKIDLQKLTHRRD